MKSAEKHAALMQYIEHNLCQGVPPTALRQVVVLVSCGVHCAFRSPLHMHSRWTFEAARLMRRLTREGFGNWVWQESVGASEYAYHPATGAAASASDFVWKHWRMSDARVRLLDTFAMRHMAREGVRVLGGFYWPAKTWPKTDVYRGSPVRQKYDLAWWPDMRVQRPDLGQPSRDGHAAGA